ncbi:hypothetical protein BBR47_35900 [Brevibacillus brevis NBRC 100599]|uniref:NACHT domain-containing protein n=1 Tax=Brevibacillus brevis (strain 47 / JCM 6285 / NBRC 100599) TaxID=358681 RepID=C0ZFK8_BREBN|nr:NACHT domain-containing protein [Brevibacillus brevis]BAH44567.1 hypothetical protein BBR47_35900 [Brevibacillus brevis NBRC 100599]
MEIVSSILLSITSNFIYDLAKSFKKVNKKSIEQTVSHSFEGLELELFNLDSGAFSTFLNLYSTRVIFVDYIKYNAFTKSSVASIDKKITKEKFLDKISNASLQYVEDISDKKLNKIDVKKYFKTILEILEKKLINDLPFELMVLHHQINKLLLNIEDRIIDTLKNKPIDIKEEDEETLKEYVEMLKEVHKKNHVYGIDRIDLAKFYILPELRVEVEKTSLRAIAKNVNWTNLFAFSNLVSVIGGPGYGKTLFLKYLTQNYTKLNIYGSEALLPIYCNLKDFSQKSLVERSYSIEDFLIDSMVSNTGIDCSKITKNFLKNYLASGKCLILFDALDEVETVERERISNVIVTFFKYSNKHNKVCLTTRDRGLIPDTPIVFSVCPVTIRQVNSYLNKMVSLGKFHKEDVPIFTSQCEGLIKSEFLTNFLMVALMVSIYKAERELPDTKIQLYEKCTEYIARRRELKDKKVRFNYSLFRTIIDNDATFEKLSELSKRNNKEVRRTQIVELLTEVYKKRYLDENKLLDAIEEFLDFCAERTDLYVQGSDESHYKFFHRSFFEYFYANLIVKEMTNEQLLDEFTHYGEDSEIFENCFSILRKNNYDRYIEFVDYIFDEVDKFISTGETDLIFLRIIYHAVVSLDEEYFEERFYTWCFSPFKLITRMQRFSSQESRAITNKVYARRNCEDDLIKYYSEELMLCALIDDLFEESYLTSVRLGFGYLIIAVSRKMSDEKMKMIKSELYELMTESVTKLLTKYDIEFDWRLELEEDISHDFDTVFKSCQKKYYKGLNLVLEK